MRAGRSLRALARLIDVALLVGVVALAYSEVVPRIVDVPAARRDVFDALRAGDTALRATMLLAGLVLEVLPTAWGGWTPGKAVMGVRVRGIDGRGRPGLARSLVRWLPLAAAMVLPVLAPALLLVWGWGLGRRREGLHDRLAGTWVADAPPPR